MALSASSLIKALTGKQKAAEYSLSNFLGMFPRFQPYLIDDMAAQLIVDGNIISGGLEAFRQDTIEHEIDKLYADMYRYLRTDGTKQWLVFDKDVDLARSAVIDDATNQVYITGLGDLRTFDSNLLKKTDTTITKDNSYKAGISKPEAPTLEQVEGTGAAKETRAYLIAYARHWTSGKIDLGPCSDAAKTTSGVTYVDVDETHVAKLSNIKPSAVADEHADWIYIYRASTTSSGEGQWRYVTSFNSKGGAMPPGVEHNTGNNTYSFKDEFKEEDLGEVPSNINWTCPDNLEGLISVGNGVFAAFKGNTVYLSYPYQGHAFPSEYAIPLDYNVVGLGSFGNTLVICTQSNTYLVVVNDPSASILRPIQEAHACVSKDSIVSMADSVIYATKYGLIRVTQDGATRMTYPIISDRAWADYNPETIKAASYQGKYLMFFDSDIVEYNGAVIDFQEIKTGVLGLSQKASCVWQDDSSSQVFIQYISPVLMQPRIFAFGESNSVKRVYKWRSKKFINTEGLFTLAAGKVNFYDDSFQLKLYDFNYEKASNAFNTPQVNVFSINGDASTNSYWLSNLGKHWCKLDFYVDDRIRKTVYVYNNFPFRLPAGFRGDSFYVDITSTIPISRVQLASSIGELE